MASSHSLTWSSSYSQGRTMTLTCTQVSKDSLTNKSTIKWTLTVSGGTSTYYTTGPTEVYIGGNQVYYKSQVAWNSYSFPAEKGSVSGTTTITHTDDGSKTIDISVRTMVYAAESRHTASSSWTLDKIDRYAILDEVADFTDEESPVITYKNPAGNIVSNARAYVAVDTDYTPLFEARDIDLSETSYTFELTDDERDVLRAASSTTTSKDFYFVLASEINGTEGYTVKKAKMTLVGDLTPGLTISYYDQERSDKTAVVNNDQILVKGISRPIITVKVTRKKQAQISNFMYTCDGSSYSILSALGMGNEVTITSHGVETPITITILDSRGFRSSETIDIVNYVPPTCTIKSASLSVEGTLNIAIVGTYYPEQIGDYVVEPQLFWREKLDNGVWGEGSEVFVNDGLDGNYIAQVTVNDIDIDKVHTVQCYVSDAFNTVYSSSENVRAIPIFDWSEEDFNFNVPVKISNTPLFDLIYPIGSIYMSVNSTSPAELFGGGWEPLKDRFLLGAGDTYAAGEEDGEATHKLTISEMPKHYHDLAGSVVYWVNGTGSVAGATSGKYGKYTTDTDYEGGSQAHNNMPPYLVVYMWKRYE